VQKWWDADGPAREVMMVITGSVPMQTANNTVYDRLVARSMTKAQYRTLVEGEEAAAALASAAKIAATASAIAAAAATISACMINSKPFQDLRARGILQRQRRLQARERRLKQAKMRAVDKDSLQLVCLDNTKQATGMSTHQLSSTPTPIPSSPGYSYGTNSGDLGDLGDHSDVLPFVEGLLPMSLWSPSSMGSASRFASPVHARQPNGPEQSNWPPAVGEAFLPIHTSSLHRSHLSKLHPAKDVKEYSLSFTPPAEVAGAEAGAGAGVLIAQEQPQTNSIAMPSPRGHGSISSPRAHDVLEAYKMVFAGSQFTTVISNGRIASREAARRGGGRAQSEFYHREGHTISRTMAHTRSPTSSGLAQYSRAIRKQGPRMRKHSDTRKHSGHQRSFEATAVASARNCGDRSRSQSPFAPSPFAQSPHASPASLLRRNTPGSHPPSPLKLHRSSKRLHQPHSPTRPSTSGSFCYAQPINSRMQQVKQPGSR
jgi:hypothetical protein